MREFCSTFFDFREVYCQFHWCISIFKEKTVHTFILTFTSPFVCLIYCIVLFFLPIGVTQEDDHIIYPHCFGTAFNCDVTTQLNSRKGGGAPDTKNPDLYYFLRQIVKRFYKKRNCKISVFRFGKSTLWKLSDIRAPCKEGLVGLLVNNGMLRHAY